MNATTQALRAYSAANSPTRTNKSIEYEVVARVTSRLRSAANLGAEGFPALAQAIHDNKKLWLAFVVDLSDPANPLPADLKARLFYLAEFTNHQSSKVLARQAPIDPLLDVNLAIMQGLRNGAK